MLCSPIPCHSEKLKKFKPQGISHAFFTREGGVSQGIYQSLNVGQGSKDKPAHVAANRQAIAAYFGSDIKELVNAYQVHSATALIVDAPFQGERPKADALVTKTKDLILGVLTADCGPVLFADPHAGVIAAAHAGWRGALGGILENTIAAMERLGAERQSITAVLGPCIGPKNYEVTTEFYQTFLDIAQQYQCYFTTTDKKDHFLFNLWAFIIDRLKRAGVHASCLDLCTYADEKRFFSYRRKTHRNEADYGRQISAIKLEKQI